MSKRKKAPGINFIKVKDRMTYRQELPVSPGRRVGKL